MSIVAFPSALLIQSKISFTRSSANSTDAALPGVPLTSCVSVLPGDLVTVVSAITSPITSLILAYAANVAGNSSCPIVNAKFE